jgi:hypothetical protein
MKKFSTFTVVATVDEGKTNFVGRVLCERVAAAIKRHVDDVASVKIVAADPVCPYCGKPWTEEDPNYNGGCCATDVAYAQGEDNTASELVESPETWENCVAEVLASLRMNPSHPSVSTPRQARRYILECIRALREHKPVVEVVGSSPEGTDE